MSATIISFKKAAEAIKQVSAFNSEIVLAGLGTSVPSSEIDPVLARYKRDILEYGEVQQIGRVPGDDFLDD